MTSPFDPIGWAKAGARHLPTGAQVHLRQAIHQARAAHEAAQHMVRRAVEEGPIHAQHTASALFHGKNRHLMLASLVPQPIKPSALVAIPKDSDAVAILDAGLSATSAWNNDAPLLMSTHPYDLVGSKDVRRALGRYREIMAVVAQEDPRALLTRSFHQAPAQYAHGMDQSLFLGTPDHPAISLSDPGVLPMAQAALALRKDGRAILVAQDRADPERNVADARLRGFCGLSLAHDQGMRPDPWWNDARRRRHVRALGRAFPELEALCVMLGYPSTESLIGCADTIDDMTTAPRGTIVAFHTDDATYTQEAQRFVRRLSEMDLRWDLTTLPSRQHWVENCAMKPQVLRDARRRLSGPLLYLDVDAYVHRDPWDRLALHQDADLAAHVDRDGELQSGTLLVQDTAGARDALDAWVDAQRRAPDAWDQRTLQSLVEAQDALPLDARTFRFHRLPPTLTYILDRAYPFLYGPPIVEHLQASRESHTDSGGSRGLDRRRRRIGELFGG